jgi:hypothetical protein
LIDRTGTPQETRFSEYGTLLKQAVGHSNAPSSLGNLGLLEELGRRTVFDRVEEAWQMKRAARLRAARL